MYPRTLLYTIVRDIPVNLLHLSGYSSTTPIGSFQTNAASTAVTSHHFNQGTNQDGDSIYDEEPSSWMETENASFQHHNASAMETRTKPSTPRIHFGSSKVPSLLTYSPGSTQYTAKLDYKDFTDESISEEESNFIE